MKQIKVIHKFHDKYNYSHIYGVGEVVSFDDERANDIVGRGLGSFVATPKETTKHESSAPAANANNDGGKPANVEVGKSSENEVKNEGKDANLNGEGKDNKDDSENASPVSDQAPDTKTDETSEVHKPAALKETKKPKSNGYRKGGKNVE